MVKDAFFGHVFHLLRIERLERSFGNRAELPDVFSGLLNTKLVEDANKFQREQEDRGNNSKQDQEIALAVHILINQDPSLSEQEVLNRIHIKTADEELPVEGMTEEMAQVLRDTIRPEDQQKIMKTLSEKNVTVAELAKKCYLQSYKKIPAKKVQEAVNRKKKEEAAQPRGTTSKRKAEKPPDAPQERAEPQVRQGG